MEAFETALMLTKEYENSEGYRIQRLLENLSRRNEIVERNYDRLSEIIEDIETHEDFPPFDVARDISTEFDRRLSNYVGSVKNREYQTRETICPRLDEMCRPEPMVSEVYSSKIAEFDVEGIGHFFTGLRGYIVHEAILHPIFYADETGTPTFAFDKQKILESDYWSQEGKGYADTWDDVIPITKLVQEFHESLKELYDWLTKYVNDRFEDRHEVQVEKEEQAKAAQEEFFEVAGIEMMTIQWESSDET